MIYRFHHKEINEIVEERVSEEDRENTNNISTSFAIGTPPSTALKDSAGMKSSTFNDSLNISENFFGSRELL